MTHARHTLRAGSARSANRFIAFRAAQSGRSLSVIYGLTGLVGKGGKEREVLLPADLATPLRAFKGDVVGAGPVFTARPSTQHRAENRPAGALSVQAVGQILQKAAQRAPLPQRVKDGVSPHWLRHAHASHALDNGAPISLVQQTLGHGSIKTTSIYAHAKPGASSALYLKKVRD